MWTSNADDRPQNGTSLNLDEETILESQKSFKSFKGVSAKDLTEVISEKASSYKSMFLNWNQRRRKRRQLKHDAIPENFGLNFIVPEPRKPLDVLPGALRGEFTQEDDSNAIVVVDRAMLQSLKDERQERRVLAEREADLRARDTLEEEKRTREAKAAEEEARAAEELRLAEEAAAAAAAAAAAEEAAVAEKQLLEKQQREAAVIEKRKKQEAEKIRKAEEEEKAKKAAALKKKEKEKERAEAKAKSEAAAKEAIVQKRKEEKEAEISRRAEEKARSIGSMMEALESSRRSSRQDPMTAMTTVDSILSQYLSKIAVDFPGIEKHTSNSGPQGQVKICNVQATILVKENVAFVKGGGGNLVPLETWFSNNQAKFMRYLSKLRDEIEDRSMVTVEEIRETKEVSYDPKYDAVLRPVFNKFDVLDQGLSRKEFIKCVRELKIEMSAIDLNKYLTDQLIDYEEFYEILADKLKANEEKALHHASMDQAYEIWRAADADESGTLSATEVKTLFDTMIEEGRIQKKKAKTMMKKLDENKDGEVDFDEFIKFTAEVDDKGLRLEEIMIEFESFPLSEMGTVQGSKVLEAIRTKFPNPKRFREICKNIQIHHEDEVSFAKFFNLKTLDVFRETEVIYHKEKSRAKERKDKMTDKITAQNTGSRKISFLS